MDFDLGQPGPSNFPRLDNEFHDDADKLHSDLVGLSLDATAASAAAGGKAEEAEAGMWSLQLEDPRKKRKGGDGGGEGGGGGSGEGDLWGEKRTVKQVQSIPANVEPLLATPPPFSRTVCFTESKTHFTSVFVCTYVGWEWMCGVPPKLSFPYSSTWLNKC